MADKRLRIKPLAPEIARHHQLRDCASFGFDSRRLQTSLTLGLPESRVSFVLASHVQAKSVSPKLRASARVSAKVDSPSSLRRRRSAEGAKAGLLCYLRASVGKPTFV